MARIIPSEVDPKEFHASYGEKKIYEALKDLPDEYIVFYSSHWNKRNKKNLSGEKVTLRYFIQKEGL